MRCLACRRPLTSEVSIRYGLGSVCLRRAVKAGTLGIEALTELTSEQRETTKRRKVRKPTPIPDDISTPDLFDMLRAAALDDLRRAVTACESVGVTVNYTIEDRHAGH